MLRLDAVHRQMAQDPDDNPISWFEPAMSDLPEGRDATRADRWGLISASGHLVASVALVLALAVAR